MIETEPRRQPQRSAQCWAAIILTVGTGVTDMAKKLFGKKKKQAATAAAEPAPTGMGPTPIITQLNALPADSPLRKRVGKAKTAPDMATILGYDPRTFGSLGQ